MNYIFKWLKTQPRISVQFSNVPRLYNKYYCYTLLYQQKYFQIYIKTISILLNISFQLFIPQFIKSKLFTKSSRATPNIRRNVNQSSVTILLRTANRSSKMLSLVLPLITRKFPCEITLPLSFQAKGAIIKDPVE